ncbi:LPS translocon maturation chaperone LptM [Deefgea rivuli]
MRALIAFVLTAFFLSACGFKGPLYLSKPAEASKPLAASPVASAVEQ